MGTPDQDHEFSSCVHLRKDVPVVGPRLKKLSPDLSHLVPTIGLVSVAVDETMMLCHQVSETIEVARVDLVVEANRDRDWVGTHD